MKFNLEKMVCVKKKEVYSSVKDSTFYFATLANIESYEPFEFFITKEIYEQLREGAKYSSLSCDLDGSNGLRVSLDSLGKLIA